MNTKNRLLLPVLVAGLSYLLGGQLAAQTFRTLYSFTGGSDGGGPGTWGGALILSNNVLYGTSFGGLSGSGTIFGVNTDGTGFTTLYSFTPAPCCPHYNSDGFDPNGHLVLSGNTLYGTCNWGGGSGTGTVFGLNTDGTGFTTIYGFTGVPDLNNVPWGPNSNGAFPQSGLILSGGALYGTALGGGSSGNGTVFQVNTDGTGFTVLYAFSGPESGGATNSDGAAPSARLIVLGNTLYGTAAGGGISGAGTVFKLNTDGTDFAALHSFANTDGNGPEAGLTSSGGVLYGTTINGGSSGNGTVFRVNTDGTDFKTLHNFTTSTNQANTDGWLPEGELVLSGNTLYGTCRSGGSSTLGTIFAVNTDGTDFKILHAFTGTDGARPNGLLLFGSTLYGTCQGGGSSGWGTVFSISLPVTPPQLTIAASGPNVILTWPTNATGFNLQSTTNLGASAIWTTNLPAPVVGNGQNTVTNPISGAHQFYRLSQ